MISGERVRLRAVEHSDLASFVQWLNDPEVTAGLMIYLPMSADSEEQWYENMLKSPADEHPLVIEVKSGEDWKPVGNIGLHNINGRNRSAEIGIFIGDKSVWNQGYGSEAMQLMLRHGFETLNLHRIFLRVYKTNPRAIRSYEKVGFVHEGILREDEYRQGQYVDVLFMSVLEDEWRSKQGKK